MKSGSKAGCAGAVWIHPLLFLVGFAKGAIFGHPEPQVMSATSGYGAVEHGLAGAMNAGQDILVHYVMTLGILAILVSVAGAGLAFSLKWMISVAKSDHR